jgi:hypothetical protein
MELPWCLAILLLGVYPKELKEGHEKIFVRNILPNTKR